MNVQKLAVHIVFVGGTELRFIANSVNVSSDMESYVFTSFPGNNSYTVLEPVAKKDIAFISIETKLVSEIPASNTKSAASEDLEEDNHNG